MSLLYFAKLVYMNSLLNACSDYRTKKFAIRNAQALAFLSIRAEEKVDVRRATNKKTQPESIPRLTIFHIHTSVHLSEFVTNAPLISCFTSSASTLAASSATWAPS
jgi:hypothetical protein